MIKNMNMKPSDRRVQLGLKEEALLIEEIDAENGDFFFFWRMWDKLITG